INKVKFAFTHTSSRFKQPANEWAESVQSSNPLLIRTDQRESRSEVRSNKSIGLLERIYSEKALHQSNSDDFGICESRISIGRGAPMSQAGVGFEEVINEDVGFSHLIYNGSQMGRP